MRENIFYRLKRKISDFFYSVSIFIGKLFHKNKKTNFAEINHVKMKKSAKIKQTLCIWSFLIIPIIDLIVFWVYGTLKSFPIAFEHHLSDGSTVYDFSNFDYLFKLFGEENNLFFESLFNTLKYWVFSFFVLTPISFLMGFFLYKRIAGFRVFRYVFFFPTLISSVIMCAFFKVMFGPGGQIPYLMDVFFGIKDMIPLADSDYAFKTMLFFNFYMGLTGNLLYWLAAFARIPEEIVEAAKIDGVTVFKEFIYITFPITWPFFSTMLLLMCTGILSASGPALLLTGGAYGTYDLGYWQYVLTVSGGENTQGYSGAIALLIGVIVLPFTLVINHFVNKIEPVEF